MSDHTFPQTWPRARRQHRCTWCGQTIAPGDRYRRWYSINEGAGFTNKMHPECERACEDDHREFGDGYNPFDNARPPKFVIVGDIPANPETVGS